MSKFPDTVDSLRAEINVWRSRVALLESSLADERAARAQLERELGLLSAEWSQRSVNMTNLTLRAERAEFERDVAHATLDSIVDKVKRAIQ